MAKKNYFMNVQNYMSKKNKRKIGEDNQDKL